jgi:hypothetical protein
LHEPTGTPELIHKRMIAICVYNSDAASSRAL